jgi:hypothetical protein
MTTLGLHLHSEVWGMLKALERSVLSVDRRLVLLAPHHATDRLADRFANVTYDSGRRDGFVKQMQALRGSVYLQEGNLKADQLSPDGRHETAEDDRSWHLLWRDGTGTVTSCAWYLEHEDASSMRDLRVRHCPLVDAPEWRDPLRQAVESELGRAEREGLRYAEVGGWAVSKARRCTSEGLVLALAAYGLCRVLGDALGITTANVKHSSSSILRRLGGSYLEFGGVALPAYFDRQYNATIELLRFDSRRPSAKYAGFIEMLGDRLKHVCVVADTLYKESEDSFDGSFQLSTHAWA